MHILKCKQDENRNKILRNRIFIRKQSQSNPHLEDIVNRYDDYYEEFKNKMVMQIGALNQFFQLFQCFQYFMFSIFHVVVVVERISIKVIRVLCLR
jgi:hypothetical protein